ncbi:hypothetical protein HQN87_07355 [Paenibacillus tritici]|uniref:YncE family protein n=1 Tax=Paenibacillus tritici TaxID=1873425 RepID=A0ABX2DKK2_9BACL|nr:hypothetical protein [Paenibacillus tritici]
MNTNMENRRRNLASGYPYVFVSYVASNGGGHVAVVDPAQNTVIQRIKVGFNPGPMCLNYQEDKLYVVNIDQDFVTVIDTYTLKVIKTVHIGSPSTNSAPVAIFAASSVNKVYVAHSGDRAVTIIDSVTDEVIKQVDMVPAGSGYPFAFASHKNAPYVFVACKSKDTDNGNVVAISYLDDSVYPVGDGIELTFDGTHNPLTAHPLGQTQVTLGPTGMLTYFGIHEVYQSKTLSLLDNTVSGVYLDNGLLFCISQENKTYLKQFKNLRIDYKGHITFDQFTEISSFKGQDKIRASSNQNYIGVTIQPTNSHTGGLQIYDVNAASSRFVPLSLVGDLAFAGDNMAYVGDMMAIIPIDVVRATALPGILIGINFMDLLTVKNIISGYSYQSL